MLRRDHLGRLRIVAILLLLGAVSCSFNLGQGVPVVPNDSLVKAHVMKYSIVNSLLEGMEPEQTLYSLIIKVLTLADVEGEVNYLRRYLEDNEIKIGNVEDAIRVLSHEELSPSLFGKTIEANVRYVGDEWGGAFLIRNIKVVEQGDDN